MNAQQLLQSFIDSADAKSAGISAITATVTSSGVVAVTPTPSAPPAPAPPAPPPAPPLAPPLAPPPTPPPALPSKPQRSNVVSMSADKWFKDVGGNSNLSLAQVNISQGGLVHFVSSGNLRIDDCCSLGAPSGKGMYFIIVATGGAANVVVDNSGLKDAWIFHGHEAAIRIMGGCKKATLTNVDLCGRMHDTRDKGIDDGRSTKLLAIPRILSDGSIVHPAALGGNVDWWKQVIQWRDVKEALWQGGRCIGRWDVGRQATPNTPQRVDHLLVLGVGLTDEPHLTDPHSYGKIERKDCYKIDLAGNPIRKGGALVKWPDQVWQGK